MTADEIKAKMADNATLSAILKDYQRRMQNLLVYGVEEPTEWHYHAARQELRRCAKCGGLIVCRCCP